MYKIHTPLIVFLCLLPLQWVKLFTIGSASLKAAHLALLIPPLSLLLKKTFRMPTSGLMKIFLIHPLLFGILLFALPWSENPAAGLFIIIRLTSYYTFGLITLIWLESIHPGDLLSILSNAIFYVVPMFLLAFTYYVAVSGVNILEIITKAVQTGNANYIQFYLFVMVMNKGNRDGLSDEEMIDAAGRHGIMIFLILIMFARILSIKGEETTRKKILGLCLCWIIVLTVFVSLSRAALLILFCACAMWFANLVLLKRPGFLAYWGILGAASLVVTYIAFSGGGNLSDLIYEKLYVDVINNPRVREYSQIFFKINERVLLGYGTGTELNIFGLRGKYSHNLILYWWHQAGFIGLVGALGALIFFISTTIKLWRKSLSSDFSQQGQLFLLSSILLLPAIIRMMVAKQGALALTEWMAVSLCVAIYSAQTRIIPIYWTPKAKVVGPTIGADSR